MLFVTNGNLRNEYIFIIKGENKGNRAYLNSSLSLLHFFFYHESLLHFEKKKMKKTIA